MEKNRKKQLKKHKRILEALKNCSDFFEVYHQFGITAEDIKFWRKTIFDFDKQYLESIGLTAVQEQFLEVFKKKMLNVAATCRAINISRDTFYRWSDTSDTFRMFLDEIREGLKDDIESIIYEKIFSEKDSRIIMLYAKSKMRDRGYGTSYTFIAGRQQDIFGYTSEYSTYTIEEIEAELAKLEDKKIKKLS